MSRFPLLFRAFFGYKYFAGGVDGLRVIQFPQLRLSYAVFFCQSSIRVADRGGDLFQLFFAQFYYSARKAVTGYGRTEFGFYLVRALVTFYFEISASVRDQRKHFVILYARKSKNVHNPSADFVEYYEMKQNIYKSAAIVTIFSTIEKLMSFFYRVVLSRVIGAEGIGIYQICLSVFAVFLTAASSGIPITVSRLIAKSNTVNDIKGKNSAVTAGVVGTLIFTVPIAAILFLGRNALDFLFTDDRCIDIFLILLPGLILTSVYAVMRGSFWGNKQFVPYSVIELLEDAVMVILGCILVFNVTDPVLGARRATIAVAVSYVFSFCVSLFWYFKKGGRFVNPRRQLKPLFSSSMPITAMRTSTSLLNSAVAVLLPLLLMKTYGLDNSDAISLYGVAIGMSLPILFIPSSLIGSISVVVAPELSENFYKKKTEQVRFDIEKSIKAAIFIATLLVPILFVLGDEIGEFLYSNQLSGEIVQRCSFILVPMCLSMITTTILNSMNHERRTLIHFLCGAVLMIISIVFLTRYVGIYSYMIGLAASFVITCVLNLLLLRKSCKGLKYMKYSVHALIVTVSACVFGMLLDGIISKYVSAIWQIVILAFATTGFAVAFLFCFEMFTLRPLKRLISKN